MRPQRTGMLSMVLAGLTGAAQAALQLVPGDRPACIFSGEPSSISVMFSNSSDHDFNSEISARIFQTSSATAVPVSEAAWKSLRVLPQQTVLESAQLDFPAVNAQTEFLIQWLEKTNRIMGKTEVLVYPTNLLNELKLLVHESDNNLGVLDPGKKLQPALKQAGIPFVNLENTPLPAFAGKLALVGPCAATDPEWPGLTGRIRRLAQSGVPVIWIRSSPAKPDVLWPSYCLVPAGRAGVLVADPGLVSDLPDNPQSQLNLIFFCKLALNPQPLALPELTSQP